MPILMSSRVPKTSAARGRVRTALLRVSVAAALVSAVAGVPIADGQVPKATDYHSLLVSSSNPRVLLLGTHDGIFRSTDAGATWRAAGLKGDDAMNLVQSGPLTLMGGHDVFAVSRDGGVTWRATSPKGLPGLDVHGLAADPRHPNIVYAQIAGTGLYRSTDSGASFALLSADVNGGMMPVAVSASGHLVVGDMSRGIFTSATGKHWLHTATGMVMGLAADPADPNRLVAASRGIAVSDDGGRSWQPALRSKVMFGPVAWSSADPAVVYAVGYDRSLWKSSNAGRSWKLVG